MSDGWILIIVADMLAFQVLADEITREIRESWLSEKSDFEKTWRRIATHCAATCSDFANQSGLVIAQAPAANTAPYLCAC